MGGLICISIKRSEKFFDKKQAEQTKAKIQILNSYIAAWYPIVTTHEPAVYIDGFSGKGFHDNGDVGSPLLYITIIKLLQHVQNVIYLMYKTN